jgi:hypothetical protein
MLEKIKKIGIIIIIAILFSTFSFSIVDLVIERPNYEDYCGFEGIKAQPLIRDTAKECSGFIGPTESEQKECNDQRGYIEYTYDENGCATKFSCNTCSAKYQDASDKQRLMGFIITSIIGIMAIIVGMYMKSGNEIMEWVFSGILIGGIATVFISTVSYYSKLDRFVKPIILLIEMGLIIWVAIRTSKKK